MATPLKESTTWDGVKIWMSQALEEEQYTQALQTLEARGERPDGDVLLNSSATELVQGLGLPFSVAKKIERALQKPQQASQSMQSPSTGGGKRSNTASKGPARDPASVQAPDSAHKRARVLATAPTGNDEGSGRHGEQRAALGDVTNALTSHATLLTVIKREKGEVAAKAGKPTAQAAAGRAARPRCTPADKAATGSMNSMNTDDGTDDTPPTCMAAATPAAGIKLEPGARAATTGKAAAAKKVKQEKSTQEWTGPQVPASGPEPASAPAARRPTRAAASAAKQLLLRLMAEEQGSRSRSKKASLQAQLDEAAEAGTDRPDAEVSVKPEPGARPDDSEGEEEALQQAAAADADPDAMAVDEPVAPRRRSPRTSAAAMKNKKKAAISAGTTEAEAMAADEVMAVPRAASPDPEGPMEIDGDPTEAEEVDLTSDKEDAADRDYAPSPARGGVPAAHATNGRRRARGALAEEVEVLSDSGDEDVDVEMEAEPDDILYLPRADGQALPRYKLTWSEHDALAGFRLFLEDLNLQELIKVSEVLDLPVEEMRTYVGRAKDKDTGETFSVERKRSPAQWRKEILRRLCEEAAEAHPSRVMYPGHMHRRGAKKAEETMGNEEITTLLLTELAQDEDTSEYLRRYLDNCFRVHPGGDDPEALVDTLVRLWSRPKLATLPEALLLGTRTIHLARSVKTPKGWKPVGLQHKSGSMRVLHNMLVGHASTHPTTGVGEWIEPCAFLDKGKHNAEEALEIRDWLRNAMRLPQTAASATYAAYMDKRSFYVEVKVELMRREVLAGTLDVGRNPDVPAPPDPDDDTEPCHLLELYKGLDHVRASTAAHKPFLARAEELASLYTSVVGELRDAHVEEEGRGPDGLLNLGQMEELLAFCEGQEYEEPQGLKRVLKKLKLKLLPYQRQALAAVMQEEGSSGTARHLFVELPVPQQPKYDPAELDRQREEREAMRRFIDDSDPWGAPPTESEYDSEYDDLGPYQPDAGPSREERMIARKEAENARAQAPDAEKLHERAQQGRSGASGYLDPETAQQLDDMAPGIRPVLRLFYSAALNCFLWGASVKEMSKNSKVSLPIERGIMCCLEVGMGKTAVALGAAVQARRSMLRHAGRALAPDEWTDELLYDGYDGFPGHLYRGGTLVIAPRTLLPQWESIEITKFLGREFRQRVVNSSGLSGTRRPTLPCHLAAYDLVLVTPEMLSNKVQMTLYASVVWERVVVDEAHQEPGLLDALARVPKRSLLMLTGTPVVGKPEDMSAMLSVLRMPSYTTLARSASTMGYVLRSTMIRYTNEGSQLTGSANLLLPPKKEVVVTAGWGQEAGQYATLQAACKRSLEEYLKEVEVNKARMTQMEGRKGRKPSITARDCAVQGLRLLDLARPLRHACSGGIAVRYRLPRAAPGVKREPGTADYACAAGPSQPAARYRADGEYELGYNDPDGGDEVEFIFQAKIRTLVGEIKRLQEDDPGTKMCIFSCFNGTLDAVEAALGPRGFNFRTMRSGMSMKQRSEALAAFMNDPPTTIFLLSAHLASVGLTLVSASHMFLMEPSLNPAQEVQAVGRIHRLGQTRPVTITRIVMQDSVEGRIRDLLAMRAANGRASGMWAPANTKAKVTGRRVRNSGDDVSGVAMTAATEELMGLFD